MSSNIEFVILTPNARREKVKLTPNTTLLEVLEDVCKKHGYNAMEWNLTHYNKVVELGNSVRFSGLPNKANLEMVAAPKARQESNINLGLQIESGKRLLHPFSASSTLWDVIDHWMKNGEVVFPNENSNESDIQPVCVYMRQEVVGEEELKNKTLRSLGLTSGSACIRLLHRSVNQLKYQANVSGPLPSRPSTAKNFTIPNNEEAQITQTAQNEPTDNTNPQSEELVEIFPVKKIVKEVITLRRERSKSPPVPMETDAFENISVPNSAPLDLSSKNKGDEKIETIQLPKVRVAPVGALNILGEHDAVLYHGDDVEKVSTDEVPDSFFEHTRSDLEVIYRGLKAKRDELENAPLTLSSDRAQLEEVAVLNNLKLHPVTVVRIRFPDRYVLQGTFRGVDTVESLIIFTRNYLQNPQLNFYLFTSPPKTILEPSCRLIENRLVGSAVVYFGTDEMCTNYLKEDVISKVSCPTALSHHMRNLDKNEKIRIDPNSLKEHPENKEEKSGSSSSSGSSSKPVPNANFMKKNVVSDKVPKWFRPPK